MNRVAGGEVKFSNYFKGTNGRGVGAELAMNREQKGKLGVNFEAASFEFTYLVTSPVWLHGPADTKTGASSETRQSSSG